MASFEDIMLPHLPTAYNLARWLLRNDHDAEDAVQEAYLRAYQAFGRFRGGDGRAWLLTIVRNGCYSHLRKRQGLEPHAAFDDAVHGATNERGEAAERLQAEANAELLAEALAALPEEMREVILLHDLEGLPYKEIAAVVGIPLGTVMSRLGRARERLHREIVRRKPEGRTP
jgi:RNA polymerase sigma-70 factor (ECF subfamily)